MAGDHDGGWVDAASVGRGQTWAVTFVLKAGAGAQEIKESLRLAGGDKGQDVIWSPYFSARGFGPGKMTSSGGFPGGWAFEAASESDKNGKINWSGVEFSTPNGPGPCEIKVEWTHADGSVTRYAGRGTLVGQGNTAEDVAAGLLLTAFGANSGVRFRAADDPKPQGRGQHLFMFYEYRVGEGKDRKQGAFRLFNRKGYWNLAEEQPSEEVRSRTR